MSARKRKRAAKVRTPTAAEIAQVIDTQRLRLFEAAAVVDICRHASVSNLEDLDGDQLATALTVVFTLIDGVACALEKHGGGDS